MVASDFEAKALGSAGRWGLGIGALTLSDGQLCCFAHAKRAPRHHEEEGKPLRRTPSTTPPPPPARRKQSIVCPSLFASADPQAALANAPDCTVGAHTQPARILDAQRWRPLHVRLPSSEGVLDPPLGRLGSQPRAQPGCQAIPHSSSQGRERRRDHLQLFFRLGSRGCRDNHVHVHSNVASSRGGSSSDHAPSASIARSRSSAGQGQSSVKSQRLPGREAVCT